jgi:hypothetical protein
MTTILRAKVAKSQRFDLCLCYFSGLSLPHSDNGGRLSTTVVSRLPSTASGFC